MEEPKQCPKCGDLFGCLALEKISNTNIQCWCESITVSDKVLKGIAEKFDYQCLCPKCLKEYEEQ